MSNKITLDKINERLAKSAVHHRPLEDYDYGDPLPRKAHAVEGEDDDSGQTLSAGFIATVMSLFVVVGGGTFYFTGGNLPVGLFSWHPEEYSSYVSPLDASCGKDWVSGWPNDRQLQCYLTTNVARLCNADERRHMVRVLIRYSDGLSKFDQAYAKATVGSIKKVQRQSMQIGLETAKLTNMTMDPKAKPDAVMEQDKRVMDIMSDVMSGPEELLAERQKNMVPHGELVSGVANLVSRGFLTKDDFGWYSNKLFDEGLAAVTKATKPVCPD